MIKRVEGVALAMSLFAAIGGLTACGGNEDFDPGLTPGAEGVEKVVTIFSTALSEGDAARACSLMHKDAQRSLEARVGADSCPSAVAEIHSSLSTEAIDALQDIEIDSIDGADTKNAEALVSGGGLGAEEALSALGGSTVSMSIQDERWGIEAIG